MKKIAILDYSIGNIFSVFQACKEVDLKPELVSDPKLLSQYDGVILPGVGAFSKGIQNLKERGLDQAMKEHIHKGKPFMGVCLGMQLLLDNSEEFGGGEGLGFINGEVKHLKNRINVNLPVPKISWDTNSVAERSWKETPLMSLTDKDDVYFVHSYYCDVKNAKDILAFSEYGGIKYCSAILSENIFATQFHPEKSGKKGIEIYNNWKNLFFK